jgi:hypothetical protein
VSRWGVALTGLASVLALMTGAWPVLSRPNDTCVKAVVPPTRTASVAPASLCRVHLAHTLARPELFSSHRPL